jgi:hypothetical protein
VLPGGVPDGDEADRELVVAASADRAA